MQVQRQFVEVKDRRVVIELPASFVNHRVELIALTVDEDMPVKTLSPTGPSLRSPPRGEGLYAPRRQPHPDIAGKGKTLGDLVAPIVDEADWECLK